MRLRLTFMADFHPSVLLIGGKDRYHQSRHGRGDPRRAVCDASRGMFDLTEIGSVASLKTQEMKCLIGWGERQVRKLQQRSTRARQAQVGVFLCD